MTSDYSKTPKPGGNEKIWGTWMESPKASAGVRV